jgi:hypothetical protein
LPKLFWYAVSSVSGKGSHTRVTPTGFKMSTCVVTSNTRHFPAVSLPAHANRGSIEIAATPGRVRLALRNVRLRMLILLIRHLL